MHFISTTYKLTRTEINTKSAKYLYQIVDQNGNIASERKSNREYVGCSLSGWFFFGRLDLIGKGDHKKRMQNCIDYKQPNIHAEVVVLEQ